LQGDTQGRGYPFNKNGTGNQGYLFNLNKELAKFFLNKIIQRNPSVKNINYLNDILDNA
jgi:hypothetical protein